MEPSRRGKWPARITSVVMAVLLAASLLTATGSGAATTADATARRAAPPALSTISAGFWHSCAVTDAGGVKCWGRNDHGQLGIEPHELLSYRPVPDDVPGLTSGVAAISAGANHTCALTTAGGVKCWGNNDEGQLGDGTKQRRASPVDVTGLTSGVAAISAGGAHTCALTTVGGMKCWGRNNEGQLGDGTFVGKDSTVGVPNFPTGVAQMTAGGAHTCAVTALGAATCWGGNHQGQLGDGTLTGKHTPDEVPGLLTGVAAMSAGGAHTCALTTAGGVKCWGWNEEGQIGDGTTGLPKKSPVDVTGLAAGVDRISAGGAHTCVLTTAGGVKCWGADDYGQVGDGTFTVKKAPVDVTGLGPSITELSAGAGHTCATGGGSAWCWGNNEKGQLADGTTVDRRVATPLVFIAKQKIRMDLPKYIHFGDPPKRIWAFASSNLPLTFEAKGPCRMKGQKLTTTKPGTCKIVASQAGSPIYLPTKTSQAIKVRKAWTSMFMRPRQASVRSGGTVTLKIFLSRPKRAKGNLKGTISLRDGGRKFFSAPIDARASAIQVRVRLRIAGPPGATLKVYTNYSGNSLYQGDGYGPTSIKIAGSGRGTGRARAEVLQVSTVETPR